MSTLPTFEEIWAVDFEFIAQPGERPVPVCLVARELRSGRTIKQWRGEFSTAPPFRTDAGLAGLLTDLKTNNSDVTRGLAMAGPLPCIMNAKLLVCAVDHRFRV